MLLGSSTELLLSSTELLGSSRELLPWSEWTSSVQRTFRTRNLCLTNRMSWSKDGESALYVMPVLGITLSSGVGLSPYADTASASGLSAKDSKTVPLRCYNTWVAQTPNPVLKLVSYRPNWMDQKRSKCLAVLLQCATAYHRFFFFFSFLLFWRFLLRWTPTYLVQMKFV